MHKKMFFWIGNQSSSYCGGEVSVFCELFLFRIFFGKKHVFINVKCVISAKFATFAKKLKDKRKLFLPLAQKGFITTFGIFFCN
jgi:hypothetical protein